MSSTFDDASLVFIPSGYKTSKVYSVKPTDGSGDLTFTRSNDTASRVASNGLIERVRTNLAQRSDAFDNAYWIKSASSVTANATTNPLDGATNADKLVESATTASHFIYNSSLTPAAVNHTYSVYAKAAERTSIQLVSFNGSTDAVGLFNLSTGVVTTQTNGIARIESVGGGWYRCSITHTNAYVASASDYWGQIFLVDGSGNTNYAGNGTSGLFIFGAQFEVSDFGATSYIATTSAAVSVGPVANVPRLDYLNSSCPRLLLEPQRTNAFFYSEQFDNAYWAKVRATITANGATSPDGYANADIIFPDTTPNTSHELFNNSAFASGNGWSAFFKSQGHRWVYLFGSGDPVIFFDLQNGVVGNVGAGLTAKIENYGNGWYRCSYFKNSGNNIVWGFGLAGGNGQPTISGTPNTSQGVQIYGFQAEAGAYATSYIPTLGAAVTRGADSALNFSALVNNTSFTLFFEGSYTKADADYFDLLVGVNQFSGNYFSFYSGFRAIYDVGGGVQTLGPALAPNTVHKVLVKYDGTTAKYYRNGSLFLSISATGLGTFADGYIYNNDQEGLKVNQLLYFPTALSDADCAALTA